MMVPGSIRRNCGPLCYRVGCLLAIFLFLTSLRVHAQVTVAPTALYITEDQRFATVTIRNTTDTEQEVGIEFQFGYPTSDSVGNMRMQYEDPEAAETYSIAPHIRGFPQKFVVPPGQVQNVRLTVRPNSDLPSGMYWTRLITTSTPRVELQAEAEGQINTQIRFRFRQVTAVFYRKGNPNTGLNIQGLETYRDTSGLYVLARVERTGNAPYLGSTHFILESPSGETVIDRRETVAVYFSMVKRFQVPVDQLSSGKYQATVRFETARNDIPESNLIQASPSQDRFSLTIP